MSSAESLVRSAAAAGFLAIISAACAPFPASDDEETLLQSTDTTAVLPSAMANAQCRHMVRSADEPKAFFGLVYGSCADPGGDERVYVLGYSYFNGRSPARESGLALGDQIVGINACLVDDGTYLAYKLAHFTPGNLATLDVVRSSGLTAVSIRTEKRQLPLSRQRWSCSAIGLRDGDPRIGTF